MKYKKAIIALLILFVFVSYINAQKVVKVGAFNFYPAIFQDLDGEVKGFYVDAFQEIETIENIKFVYVFGTWAEGLERIKSGEIDIMVSVANNDERAKYMDYSSLPLLTVWGEVYTARTSEIDGVLDLAGKTIAIMKADNNGMQFKVLTEKLSIICTYIETDDFEQVFQLVANGEVDAGVVNNTFGTGKHKEYELRSSGIIFNPFDIFLTTGKNKNTDLLKMVDAYMDKWRHDENSIYNTSRQKWSRGEIGMIKIFPKWLNIVIYPSISLLFVLFIFIIILRYRVRIVTLEVKTNEELYRSTFQTALDGFWVTDIDGNIIEVNDSYCKMSGFSVTELLTMHVSDLEVLDSSQDIKKRIRKLIKQGHDFFESQHRTKSGNIIDIEASLQYHDIKGGRFICFIHDITERKQAELKIIKAKEKAEESESVYLKLFSEIPDGVYKTSHEGTFIDANPAMVNMLGYNSKEELLKIDVKSDLYFDVSDRESLTQDNVQSELGVYRIRKKDGSEIWVEDHGWYTLDDFGNILYHEGVTRDVTDRIRAEQELFAAKNKAEESDRLKSAFLSNMSHEMRTPMNGILGFIDLLNEPDLSKEEIEEYSAVINRSSDRLLTTINDIIDISRIESGEMVVSKEETSLNSMMDELYSFFSPEVKLKGLSFLLKPTTEQLTINIDSHKLHGILMNLIKNAIKFTEKGSITFGYVLKKGTIVNEQDMPTEVEFFVEDTGAGIPKDRIQAIFNRFEQADIEDRRAFEGSGLGLAISKAYVEMLGGEIIVESEHGKGSKFTFVVPYIIPNAHQNVP